MLNKSQSQTKTLSRISFWDRLGITLSALCLVHCVATPILLLLLPFMTHSFLNHTYFHVLLALLIVPVGLFAFYRGFRHHRQRLVLFLGIPGLALVAFAPIVFHFFDWEVWSPLFVSIGSVALVTAHWKNQRACACEHHHH